MSITNEYINLSIKRGYLIALISAVILSTTAIFIRHLIDAYQMPALVLAFWRDLFTALTLLCVFVLLRKIDMLRVSKKQLLPLVIYGLVLAVFNGLWTLSVEQNGAAVSTVLVYCSAAFTAVLGWWFLKEQLGLVKVIAVLLSLGGCVLVSGAYNLTVWDTNLIGLVTGITSGLMYAIYSLMGRSASQRGLSPWVILFYGFSFGSVFLFVFNMLPGGVLPGAAIELKNFFWLRGALAGWGILFLLAAGPTLAGYGLYNVSLSMLPSSVANLILTSEPAFTAVIAYFVFGEKMGLVQLAGGLLILSCVVFLRVYEGFQAGQLRIGRRHRGKDVKQSSNSVERSGFGGQDFIRRQL